MFPFVFSPKKSFSHLLILISCGVSVCGFLFPGLISLFGMNALAFLQGHYEIVVLQVLLFQFLHGGIMHLFMNSYFLYTAGPILEARMSQNRYFWFFITSTVVVAAAIFWFAPFSTTIGISGFCMALLSYLWIDLATTRHPGANQILTMLLLDIGIGFLPGISLVGHLSGALWGIMWWAMFRDWRK